MALSQEDIKQVLDEIENRGKELKERYGVRRLYAAFGFAGGVITTLVIGAILRYLSA